MPLYIKLASDRTENMGVFTTTPEINGSVMGTLYYISSFLVSVFYDIEFLLL